MPRKLVTLMALSLVTSACQSVPLGMMSGQAGTTLATAASQATVLPPVMGTVQFPEGLRGVQALPSDVLSAATVTLINPATNQAVTSGITNAAGAFQLQFSGGFVAAVGNTFVVEAFKGLGNNGPGYASPRFRTIIQLTANGWTSISGTTIVINALTTAVAIQSALDATNIPASSTIGKITPPATLAANAFAPAHPDAEVYQLSSDISNYLTTNLDPLLSVSGVIPSINGFSPSAGGAGTLVTVTGNGFNAVPGSTTVTFNNVPANVIFVAPRLDLAGQSRLTVVVPNAFTTGKIRVSTPLGTAVSGSDFSTLIPTITSLSVASGSIGEGIVVNGTNFDVNRDQNIVRFNGALGTVTAATATRLNVTVPVGATTGNLVVSTAAGGSNTTPFTVHPTVVSLSRTSGPVGCTVVINGFNFDAATPSNNQVRFNGILATVSAATATTITCTVPAGAAIGPLTVAVGTEQSVATPFYVVPPLSGTGRVNNG
jgi:hypothetical protein